MSKAKRSVSHEQEPLTPRPRPEERREEILARINTRYENSLRYLGR